MQFPATTFTAIICDAVIQEKYTLLLSGQINWLRGLGCNKAKPFICEVLQIWCSLFYVGHCVN